MERLPAQSGRWLLVGLLLALSTAAQAQDPTIGDVAEQMQSQMEGFGALVMGGSFLAGLGMAAASMFAFKSHSEGNGTLGKPLVMAIFASFLIGTPSFLSALNDSLETDTIEVATPAQTVPSTEQHVVIEQEQGFSTGRDDNGRRGGF